MAARLKATHTNYLCFMLTKRLVIILNIKDAIAIIVNRTIVAIASFAYQLLSCFNYDASYEGYHILLDAVAF